MHRAYGATGFATARNPEPQPKSRTPNPRSQQQPLTWNELKLQSTIVYNRLSWTKKTIIDSHRLEHAMIYYVVAPMLGFEGNGH